MSPWPSFCLLTLIWFANRTISDCPVYIKEYASIAELSLSYGCACIIRCYRSNIFRARFLQILKKYIAVSCADVQIVMGPTTYHLNEK